MASLKSSECRTLLLICFRATDNAPAAPAHQRRCRRNRINDVAKQRLFRPITYSPGLMHGSISLGTPIIKRKVKSAPLQPRVIKCRLEKQPAASQPGHLSQFIKLNPLTGGDSFKANSEPPPTNPRVGLKCAQQNINYSTDCEAAIRTQPQ